MNDLYDRIRPADEVLDADTSARIWARVANGAAGGSADSERRDDASAPELAMAPRVDEPQRRRRIAGWAAAAAVAVGIAGTAAVVATRPDAVAPADTPAQRTPAPQPDTSSALTEDPDDLGRSSASSAAAEAGLSSGTKFVVADVLPDGWSVSSLRAEPAGSLFGEAQWAHVGADGSVTGTISVRPPILLTADEVAQFGNEFDDRVRGLPADEWRDSPNNGAAVQRNGISWVEESFQMQVSATGTAADLVRPVAEALELDVESRSATLSETFGLIAAADLDVVDDNAVKTTLLMQPEWSDSQGMVVAAEPNTFGFDLDRFVGSTQDWQPIQFGDRDAVGLRTTAGDLVGLAWLDEDMFIRVSSSLANTDDEIFEVAHGLRFVDAEEFAMVGRSVVDRINASIADWAVFDRMITTDGIEISVRSKPGGAGANALCIDAPVVDCEVIQSEGGIVDGMEQYGAAGFDLGGRRIGIAWVSSDIDAATIEPSLQRSSSVSPAELVLDEATATVVSDTTTDVGRFVVVDLPEGERPPAIRFESGDDLGPLIDLTPTVDGPFDF